MGLGLGLYSPGIRLALTVVLVERRPAPALPSTSLGLKQPGARQVALDPTLRVVRVGGAHQGDRALAQDGVNVGHRARLRTAARLYI